MWLFHAHQSEAQRALFARCMPLATHHAHACRPCRPAFNVGKGGSWLLPFLCEQYGLRPDQALIVGDRLDTDIVLGRAGGLKTALPLTGVTTETVLAAAEEVELPHYVAPNLAALAGIHAG